MTAPRGQLTIHGIVRDRNGNPKFTDAATVRQYWPRLKEEDKQYLRGQFNGEDFDIDDSST